MSKYFAESELIINEDGSCFHLHLRPEQVADKVILVGDPGRVALVASHFEEKECEVASREFHAITGTYKGKRITVQSTGIGCDNIDIVVNELDALKNIDFATRTEKPEHITLTLVRIGTCGGLQLNCPAGTFVASQKSIGFDGLINFYARRNEICDLETEAEFKRPGEVERPDRQSILRGQRPGTAQSDCRRRHGSRNHHRLRRILRSAGQRAPCPACRPGT